MLAGFLEVIKIVRRLSAASAKSRGPWKVSSALQDSVERPGIAALLCGLMRNERFQFDFRLLPITVPEEQRRIAKDKRGSLSVEPCAVPGFHAASIGCVPAGTLESVVGPSRRCPLDSATTSPAPRQ